MPRYTRSTAPWFDPATYFVTTDRDDNQCIANTLEDNRCAYDIAEDELDEIEELTFEVRGPWLGPETQQALERLVLQRCCGDKHRRKLQARESSEILYQVASLYYEPLRRSRVPAYRRTHVRRRYHDAVSWPVPPELRPQRTVLAPRNRNHAYGLMLPPAQMFTEYLPDGTTIEKVLQSAVPMFKQYSRGRRPEYYPQSGSVYAFVWPDWPGYIKIGYSTNVHNRENDLRECYPRGQMRFSIDVQFPHRIEELIHLELGSKRRQIDVCRNQYCRRTHNEWFEESLETVEDIMAIWQEISEQVPLYTKDGMLSNRWSLDVLPDLNGDYTAATLVQASDAAIARADQTAQQRREAEETARREVEERARRQAERTAQPMRVQAPDQQEPTHQARRNAEQTTNLELVRDMMASLAASLASAKITESVDTAAQPNNVDASTNFNASKPAPTDKAASTQSKPSRPSAPVLKPAQRNEHEQDASKGSRAVPATQTKPISPEQIPADDKAARSSGVSVAPSIKSSSSATAVAKCTSQVRLPAATPQPALVVSAPKVPDAAITEVVEIIAKTQALKLGQATTAEVFQAAATLEKSPEDEPPARRSLRQQLRKPAVFVKASVVRRVRTTK